MIKKIFSLCAFVPLSSLLFAQIGIGTTNLSESEILKIESSNKGVLIPRLYLPDPINSIKPAVNPRQYMVAFNNDPDYDNENSFYYTYNKSENTMAWRGVLDINIINSRLVPIRSFNYLSTGGTSQETTTQGKAVGYTIGESPEGSSDSYVWSKIPGLDKKIRFMSNKNQITVIADGMVQTNNNGNETSENSYAIGLFVDNKLSTVRVYSMSSSAGFPCGYATFNLKSNIYNLNKGEHTFGVYAVTRTKLSGDASKVFFTKDADNCSNLSSLITKGHLSVQIQTTKQ